MRRRESLWRRVVRGSGGAVRARTSIEREVGVRGRISRAWVTGWSMRRIGRGGELEAKTKAHSQHQPCRPE